MYRVKKEAKNLDKHVPGWHDRIDLDKLNMFSPEDCVIGQLYGYFGDNRPYHDGINERKVAYGSIPLGVPKNPVLYYPLIIFMIPAIAPQLLLIKQLWVKEIKQRRADDQQRKQTAVPNTFPAEWEETNIALDTSAR